MDRLRRYTVKDLYVTVFTQQLITNEDGWSKIITTDQTPPDTNNELLDSIAKLIRSKHYYNSYEFSRVLDVDNTDLNAAMRLFTGMNVRDFALRYMISEACELLQYTDMPIKDIAYYICIDSVVNFTNIFRRITSYPPDMWRSMHMHPEDIGKYKL